DDKVALDKLPKAVLSAVKARFPKANVLGATFDGKSTYEVNAKDKGHNLDISVTDAGKILVIEKEIAAKDLPKAVSDTLAGKYAGQKIERIEELTKGETISYEVLLEDA